jgi:hypothetical protein
LIIEIQYSGHLILMSQTQPRPQGERNQGERNQGERVQNDQKANQANLEAKNRRASEAAETDDEEPEIGNRFLFFNVMPSWMVSFITHLAVIIILAIVIMPEKKELTVALESGEQASEIDEMIDLNLDALEFDSEETFETEIEESSSALSETEEIMLPDATVDYGSLLGDEETNFEIDAVGELSNSAISNETQSRTGDAKNQNLRKYGGNAASEESVALALKWIIAHQLPDGGWNLDHQIGPGKHRTSPDPGSATDARAGATALALLPLLGNGQTHKAGTYKKEVQAGLEYLMKRGRPSGRGISYTEPGGTMYSHGLASIVFCEAYAMTKDPALAPFAQGTVWFIEDAQDPVGGGWRYQPRQAGDTSAVGWQMMALKSGKISGLNINPRTYKRAEKFLDYVSINYGAFYGYAGPPRANTSPADARTAVGLLCRMYMGWKKDVPGLVEGVNAMARKGPDTDSAMDMYYNYYATQVMKHIGGNTWKEWNVVMRDSLVKSQSKTGVTAGSWTPGRGHADDKGGRLYTTSLACMTLEVYYRYLPLYGDAAANDEFQLD